MRKAVGAVFLVFFVFFSATASAMELNPSGILEKISHLGPRSVIDILWNSDENHPNDWDRMMEKIGSGERSWLEVAQLLKPASDAGSSEDLNGALAVALLKNPGDVLAMAQVGPFAVQDVCTCPYVVETSEEETIADTYLNSAEKTLTEMTVPIDNPSLDNVRNNCLAIIRGMQRRDYGKIVEEQRSSYDRNSALDRDAEFQSLLTSIGTGTDDALKNAKNLYPVMDPIKLGYFNQALMRALPNNPLGVLSMVEDGYVGVTEVCRTPCLERECALQHLLRSERALCEHSAPKEDGVLASIWGSCLKEIRSAKEMLAP